MSGGGYDVVVDVDEEVRKYILHAVFFKLLPYQLSRRVRISNSVLLTQAHIYLGAPEYGARMA
jgi:hypothetical protein